MVPRFTTCDTRRLREVLSRSSSEHVEAQVAEHLQSCERCRRELELLAGGAEWWSDVRSFLSSVDEALEPVPAGAEQAAGLRQHHGEHAAPDWSGWRNQLAFLAPSENPESLGRLGPYEIESVIGRGGMGIVLKARDPALDRQVAIKVLAAEYAHSGAARRRFAREARAAAAVVHDHVVPIYSIDAEGEVPYLVMAWIPGRSLQERIDREGPLEIREILRIGMQTAAGLAAAHAQGLVHRDIKPANILLEDSLERVRITDFGLARAVDDVSQTQSGILAGTPQYMSPEQASGEAIDHRTDLFSLGSLLYAMCAGHSPFRAETTVAVIRRICDGSPRPLREVNSDIPEWLCEIVEKLHAKDPARRFQSAAEVARLLERRLADLQNPVATGHRERRSVPARGAAGRRWSSRGLICCGAFALLVGLAVAAYQLVDFGRLTTGPTATREDRRVGAATAEPGANLGETKPLSVVTQAPPIVTRVEPTLDFSTPIINDGQQGQSNRSSTGEGRLLEAELQRVRTELDVLQMLLFPREEISGDQRSELVMEIEARLESLENELEGPRERDSRR